VDIAPEPVPFARIPGELEAAHIGVVPTLRDPFTELLLPVKLLEYVHMGLPAIAPRLPVIERYFSDLEVCFFEPDSAESLARAIAAVCGDPAAAHARAERAAGRLAELAWERQRERYLELMDGLAGAQPVQAGHTRRRRSFREAAGPVV
jgi:glycosyltransferase involved in cell wall biosynthesis